MICPHLWLVVGIPGYLLVGIQGSSASRLPIASCVSGCSAMAAWFKVDGVVEILAAEAGQSEPESARVASQGTRTCRSTSLVVMDFVASGLPEREKLRGRNE